MTYNTLRLTARNLALTAMAITILGAAGCGDNASDRAAAPPPANSSSTTSPVAATLQQRQLVGELTRISGMNTTVTVVVDGELYDVDPLARVLSSDGDKTSLETWVARHADVSAAHPLLVEVTVENGRVTKVQNQ